MPRRPRLTLANALWGVAYASLALAALFNPSTPAGVLSVIAVGHGLWLVGWRLDARTTPDVAKGGGTGLVSATLLVFAAIETFGLLATLSGGDADLAGWFGCTLSFAVAGIASTRRAAPGDGPFVGQLAFHVLMCVPVLGVLISAGGYLAGAGWVAILPRPIFGVSWTLLQVGALAVPLLFALLLAVLAHDLFRPDGLSGLTWPTLLAHQAVYAIIAYRWALEPR